MASQNLSVLAAVAKGGVNQGYHLDMQANRITYDGAVKAATQVRDASFDAARLRALSTVVSAVGHECCSRYGTGDRAALLIRSPIWRALANGKR